ncbi:MAG: ribonuclease D [Pseudomonadota bacterium]
MEQHLVATTGDLVALCEELKSSDHLCLDTEFLREKTYYPRLCLLQVCANGIAACVDVLAVQDLEPLRDLLFANHRIKVFHAARQDLEIFWYLWGAVPGPLFDTQPAAAVLGYGDQVGYARLVKAVLGVDLAKEQSRSDWCRRPLDAAQLAYAYDDVIHLEELYQRLGQRLRELGRTQWLAEDFASLQDARTYRVEPMGLWQRVKGRQHLKGVQLAVLQALAAWREEHAMQLDRPRRWVLRDEVIVDIARRKAGSVAQLGRIRGLEKRQLERWGDDILARIEQARALSSDAWPRETIPPRLSARQEAGVDLLQAGLRLVADAEGVTPSALAGRQDLTRMLLGLDSSLDHGWRAALAGTTLRGLLSGDYSLHMTDQGPVIETRGTNEPE